MRSATCSVLLLPLMSTCLLLNSLLLSPSSSSSSHKCNNRRDRGRLVSKLLGWGTNNVLVPQLLGCSFQKARNFTASSHQNAGFSIWVFKNFPGSYPRTITAGGGDPLSHPTPSPAFGRARSASCLVLGPKSWSPQLFSGAWLCPCIIIHLLPPPRRLCNARHLSVCLLATSWKKLLNGSSWKFMYVSVDNCSEPVAA